MYYDALFLHRQTNTFQVVIASQGSTSYAIFTYKCDLLQWTKNDAAIILIDMTTLQIIHYLEDQQYQTLTVSIIYHLNGECGL